MSPTSSLLRSESSDEDPASSSLLNGPRLVSLPTEILRDIIYRLVGTTTPHILETRALAQAEEAYALCSTHTTMRNLFRTSFDTLGLDWNAPVKLRAVARVFGSSLRHVRIRHHSHAQVFLESLSSQSPKLNSLSLRNCPISADTLKAVISSSSTTLRSLDIQFPTCEDATIASIAPSLVSLEALSLRGMPALGHVELLSLLSVPGKHMRRLSLRFLRNPSVNDLTLARIAHFCPSLTHIKLDDLRHCTARGVSSFVCSYGDVLEELDISLCKMKDEDVIGILQQCQSLSRFGIGEREVTGDGILTSLAECKDSLQAVRIVEARGFADIHARNLANLVPSLREVSLEGHNGFCDAGVISLCNSLYSCLESLEVRGGVLSDVALCAIAQCKQLRNIALGAAGRAMSSEAAAAARERGGVSTEGMEVMLKGAGRELRRFSWETHVLNIIGSYGYGATPRTVGVERLCAKELAEILGRYCKKLKVVHVTGLRPPLRNRVERAKCDLAFYELEERLPDVVLFLDTPERL